MTLAYITTSSKAEAEKIGRALVEKKLVACVNFWEGMTSIYRWEGKIESATETVLIAKTQEKHKDEIIRVVKALHSYSCPCVVFLPIEGGNPDYLHWLAENT